MKILNGTIDRNNRFDRSIIVLNLFSSAGEKQTKKKKKGKEVSNNRRFDNAFDKMITMDDCVMRKIETIIKVVTGPNESKEILMPEFNV